MIGFTLFLAGVCTILLVLLLVLDNKITNLVVENESLKRRWDEIIYRPQIPVTTTDQSGPLSVDGIEQAVRHMGYLPDRSEHWIRFMAAGEPYFIETSRLPVVFLIRQFSVDVKDWDMDLLKHAAHLMSDDLIMVKATFDDDEKDPGVRFFVAALDANCASFSDNLPRYLSIIDDGRKRMHEIYERLVKEKEEASRASAPILLAEPRKNKVLS